VMAAHAASGPLALPVWVRSRSGAQAGVPAGIIGFRAESHVMHPVDCWPAPSAERPDRRLLALASDGWSGSPG